MPSASADCGFPEFANADVELVLSPIRILKLHSDVLKGLSGVFKQLLTNENAAVLSSKKRASTFKIRWRIELVYTNLPNDIGHLRVDELVVKGRPTPAHGPTLDRKGRGPSCHVLDDWYNVIGAIYGHQIQIGTSEDGLGALLDRATNIGQICNYLQLKSSNVYAPIEMALSDTDQELWSGIKSEPHVWVQLATRLQSVRIFREAVVHLVGQWYHLSEHQKNCLDDDVHQLCSRKAEKFRQHMKDLENKVLDYKPSALCYKKGVDPVKGKREHQPDIFIWIAFSGFQLWLSKAFRDGKGVDGPDGGFDLFTRLFAGHEEYYDRRDQTKYAGCSQSGRSVVSQHVDDMKKDLKKIVAGVMTSTLRLDIRRYKINHFSCFGVEVRHCPWVRDTETPGPECAAELLDLDTAEDRTSGGEERDDAEATNSEEMIEDEDMGDVGELFDEEQSGVGGTNMDTAKTTATDEDDSDSLFV